MKKAKLSVTNSSREFKTWWTNRYGMINKDGKAFCIICSGSVVCRTSSIKRHYETIHESLFKRNVEEQKECISRYLKNMNAQTTALIKYFGTESSTTVASYQASKTIAQYGKSFNEGEFLKEAWLQCAPFLFEDFGNKEQIIQRIQDMPLARNTVKERILGMAENISCQQKFDIKSCNFISICLDESTDVTGSARLAIFARYCVKNNIKEELLSLSTLKTTTKGVDIYNAVIDALNKREICASKIVSVTTDGARSFTGQENGFINLFTKYIGHSILGFHCAIHQQVLCAKTGLKRFDDILSFVTKLVNYISARALNKRKFQDLLNEVNSSYNSLILYNNVRWLSRGNVLQRFVDCLEEIKLFLNDENLIDQYSQLLDEKWLAKLYFYTDLCSHLNELNMKLQGVNKTVIVMFELIKAFMVKLQVFNRDILSNSYKNFSNTRKLFSKIENHEKSNQEILTNEFSMIILSLIQEFSERFTQFRQFEETLKFILYPDKIDFDKLNLKLFDWFDLLDIEMQLIDFQSSSIWNQKFIDLRKEVEAIENNRLLGKIDKKTEDEILTTWNELPESFDCLKRLAKAILSIFSSTYACESLFSEMNFIKNKFRNRLTDESSSACVLLKLTTYSPDIKTLASNIQKQKSH